MGLKKTTNINSVWWINPFYFFPLLMFTILIGAISIPEDSYINFYSVNKFINYNNIWYSVAAVFFFVMGCFFTNMLLKKLKTENTFFEDVDKYEGTFKFFVFLFFLFTLFGYLMWFFSMYQHGFSLTMLSSVLMGEQGAVFDLKRNYLTKIAGVTSFTNFSIPFMILAVYYNTQYRRKAVKIMILIVVCLAVFRGVFFSERLAILEVLVPSLLITFMHRIKQRKRLKFVSIYPIVIVIGIAVLFAIGEYFRSWINYYNNVYPSYWDFITTRFFGYYVTALNTGSLYINEFGLASLPAPYFSVNWLWKFPLMGGTYENLWHLDPEAKFQNMLELSGNPEFNNPSGVLLPYHDFGLVGGITFWLLMGIVSGAFYSFFTKGYTLGLLFYPIWILGLTEVPRYLYFSSGRSFPTWIALLVFVFILSINKRHKLL